LVSLFLVPVWVGDLEVPAMHNLMCHSTRADVMLQKACQMTLVEVVEDHSAKQMTISSDMVAAAQ